MQDQLLQLLDPSTVPHCRRLGLALSAGGDSTALLEACLLAGWAPSALTVLHVDHGVRPESGAEAERVRRAADSHGIRFVCTALQWPEHVNVSAAVLRQRRHQFFEQQAAELGLDAVALAHTGDDQLETRMIALVRGSGLAGLAGMRTWQRFYWRPWLSLGRAELRAFLSQRGLDWIDDPSNTNLSSLRATVRHVVLPAIGRPAGSEQLRAEILQAENDYLNTLAQQYLNTTEGGVIELESFGQLDLALQRRVVRLWLGDADLSAERTEAVRTCCCQREVDKIRQLQLIGGRTVVAGRRFAICLPDPVPVGTNDFEQSIPWGGLGAFTFSDLKEGGSKAGLAGIEIRPLVQVSRSELSASQASPIEAMVASLKRAGVPGELRAVWPVIVCKTASDPVLLAALNKQQHQIVFETIKMSWIPSGNPLTGRA